MMRYPKLLLAFYKSSILTELEYRTNFLVNAAMSIFWLIWGIFGLRIFFNHTETIGGWSYNEALIVVALFTLFYGVIGAVIQPNIQRLVEHIQKGTLDFVLLKPVDSLFMASMRNLVIWRLFDVLLGIIVIIVALARLDWSITLGSLLFFSLMMASAALIIYSLWVILITVAFWFVKIDNITEIFHAAFEAGRYPVTAFPRWLQAALTFGIPVAFITTFPAASLVGRLPWRYGLYSVLLGAGLLLVATRFWRFALRHYTSASS